MSRRCRVVEYTDPKTGLTATHHLDTLLDSDDMSELDAGHALYWTMHQMERWCECRGTLKTSCTAGINIFEVKAGKHKLIYACLTGIIAYLHSFNGDVRHHMSEIKERCQHMFKLK